MATVLEVFVTNGETTASELFTNLKKAYEYTPQLAEKLKVNLGPLPSYDVVARNIREKSDCYFLVDLNSGRYNKSVRYVKRKVQ